MKPTILSLLLSIFFTASVPATEKPNVLILFTDDHRFSGVHALAGTQVQTPNLDRLCDEGFVFTNAFLQGSMSGATCIPSRHMLLTGRGLFDFEGSGHRIPAFCYLQDVFPTLCDLAGVEIPESVTAKSLAPLIRGDAENVRDYTYHAYRNLIRAYRKGDFKLIEYFRSPENNEGERSGSRVTQLFNVAEDPWETTDLSFLPQYREQVREMQAVARNLGDGVPL